MSEKVITLDSWQSGPARLITAPSYLIDRFVPACEIIHLPPKAVGGGEVALRIGPVLAEPPKTAGLLPRVAQAFRGRQAPQTHSGILMDFRAWSPGNWAHFLNNHIPLLVFACDTLNVAVQDCVMVLPADTPRYIREVAVLFGLAITCTNAPLSGTGLHYRLSGWPAIRAVRARWVQTAYLQTRTAGFAASRPIPAKVFLSRRKTRHLENATEVEAFLASRGYATLCPEDLSPADQFRLFEQAESIVAIHGAGLAPLLYRSPNSALRQLIEILPCGHMTDVYRMMAEQVGCSWIGLRGRIKPEHVLPAYDFDRPFQRFSLSAFSVDIRSLALALDMAGP